MTRKRIERNACQEINKAEVAAAARDCCWSAHRRAKWQACCSLQAKSARQWRVTSAGVTRMTSRLARSCGSARMRDRLCLPERHLSPFHRAFGFACLRRLARCRCRLLRPLPPRRADEFFETTRGEDVASSCKVAPLSRPGRRPVSSFGVIFVVVRLQQLVRVSVVVLWGVFMCVIAFFFLRCVFGGCSHD